MTKIGILGDGQIGQLTAIEASNMGIETIVFGNGGIDSPAGQVTKILDSNGYNPNSQLIDNFVNLKPDITTIEWESIPIELLRKLEKKGITIKPKIELLNIISNKRTEKNLLIDIGQKTTQFVFISIVEDLKKVFDDLGKGIIKNPTSYDGKGQIFINSKKDIEKLNNSDIGKNFIYEKFVDYKTEISIIVGRRSNGEIIVFEPIENKHHNGILIESISPAKINDTIKNKAKKIAIQIVEILGIEGLLTIEMFLLPNGEILINELAPRPHNSGHSTIEGYNQSQYNIFIKAILNEPFGRLELINRTRMRNILGNTFHNIPKNHTQIIKQGQNTIYNYGKKKISPGRKMGHITTIY